MDKQSERVWFLPRFYSLFAVFCPFLDAKLIELTVREASSEEMDFRPFLFFVLNTFQFNSYTHKIHKTWFSFYYDYDKCGMENVSNMLFSLNTQCKWIYILLIRQIFFLQLQSYIIIIGFFLFSFFAFRKFDSDANFYRDPKNVSMLKIKLSDIKIRTIRLPFLFHNISTI